MHRIGRCDLDLYSKEFPVSTKEQNKTNKTKGKGKGNTKGDLTSILSIKIVSQMEHDYRLGT